MSKDKTLTDKTILVTGGTGSFGQAFTRELLNNHKPKAVRIFSRDELKQWEMEKKLKDHYNFGLLRFFIGDVRDKDRLLRAMEGVDIVVHAAALKQVPTLEYNPFEAVKTNILGTQNVIECAIDTKVKKAIFISSDKAVNPINIYGATKLVAEKLFVQGNSYAGGRSTRFSVVRYGNVVASRGSVIPLFIEQAKNNIITLTDERMTRFWIALEQGVKFVVTCIKVMVGGEIFVPKIPSMKIVDLARTIAPQAKIKITGIRPGEKLHEVLIHHNESRHTKDFGSHFIVETEFVSWRRNKLRGGKNLKDNFHYSSENNDKWLTVEKLKEIIQTLDENQ